MNPPILFSYETATILSICKWHLENFLWVSLCQTLLFSVLVRLFDPWLPILTMVLLLCVLDKSPDSPFLRHLILLLFKVLKQLWTFHCSISGFWPTSETLSWRLKIFTPWFSSFGRLKTLKAVAFEDTYSRLWIEGLQLLSNTVSQLVERCLSLKPGLLKETFDSAI